MFKSIKTGKKTFDPQKSNYRMFKFNFAPEDKSENEKEEMKKEIISEPLKFHNLEISELNKKKTGKTENFERIGELEYFLESDVISDLEDGIYEGGNVLWECTLDLIKYLDQSIDCFQGKSGNIFDKK